MAASAIDKQPSGTITLLTADGAELKVDKELLCSSSKFFQGMLVACDTGRLHVEETADILGTVLAVMAGQQAPGTYDVRSTACWSTYKKVLVVADKYDMALVKERCEKWLISRCLRGRMLCSAFRFQDVAEGAEWLAMCQKYDLRDLGWYCAYDLGTQLALGNWTRPARELLDGVHCPELLKTLIEAAQATTAAGSAAAGGAAAAREQGPHGQGQGQQGQGQEQGGAAQAE